MNDSIYNDSETGVTTSALSKNEFTVNDFLYFTSLKDNGTTFRERNVTNFYEETIKCEPFGYNAEDISKTYDCSSQTLESQNYNETVLSDYPEGLLYFGATCFILFAVVGAVGNFSSILALSMCKRLRNATTAFIVNLCVADFLFCGFSMPLSAATFIQKDWKYGQELCIVFPFVRYSNGALSLFSIIAITVNRYILIVHPKIYENVYTKRRIAVMICLMWLFSPLFLLPPFLELWGKLGYDPRVGTCTILPVNGKSPKIAFFITAFIVPSIVFVTCYLRIYVIVRKGSKKAQRKVNKLPAISIDFKRKKGIINKSYWRTDIREGYVRQRNKKELRVLRVMLVVFILFVLCYFPALIVKTFQKENDLPILNVLGYLGVYLSNIVNPLIYIVMSDAYRKAYKELFCRSTVNSFSRNSTSSMKF